MNLRFIFLFMFLLLANSKKNQRVVDQFEAYMYSVEHRNKFSGKI